MMMNMLITVVMMIILMMIMIVTMISMSVHLMHGPNLVYIYIYIFDFHSHLSYFNNIIKNKISQTFVQRLPRRF